MNFKQIKEMSLTQVLTDTSTFRDQFVTLYNKCHQSQDGLVFWDLQTHHMKNKLLGDATLRKATSVSMAAALLDIAYHGLSIEPISKPMAYIYTRGHNKGSRKDPVWETRVVYQIAPYGELELRRRSGIIKYADNPVVVYDGDFFEYKDGVVHHTSTDESSVMVKAYIKITRYDGAVEYKVFSMDQIMSYKKAAKADQQKSLAWTGGVNGQPPVGMVEAKVIKHSFNTYPRLILGMATRLATDDDTFVADAAYEAVLANMTYEGDQEESEAPLDLKDEAKTIIPETSAPVPEAFEKPSTADNTIEEAQVVIADDMDIDNF